MKKHLNLSLIFAIYGLSAGVYFRELTKFNNFTERTTLGMAHVHILTLGFCGMLLVALFTKVLHIKKSKGMKIADIFYVSGVFVASAVMIARGTTEVLGKEITSSVGAMFSGIAGLGHIAVAVGIIMYLTVFKKFDK